MSEEGIGLGGVEALSRRSLVVRRVGTFGALWGKDWNGG